MRQVGGRPRGATRGHSAERARNGPSVVASRLRHVRHQGRSHSSRWVASTGDVGSWLGFREVVAGGGSNETHFVTHFRKRPLRCPSLEPSRRMHGKEATDLAARECRGGCSGVHPPRHSFYCIPGPTDSVNNNLCSFKEMRTNLFDWRDWSISPGLCPLAVGVSGDSAGGPEPDAEDRHNTEQEEQ
jgi:hypothetical protein